MPSKCAECSKVMESDLATIALHYKNYEQYNVRYGEGASVRAAKVALKFATPDVRHDD